MVEVRIIMGENGLLDLGFRVLEERKRRRKELDRLRKENEGGIGSGTVRSQAERHGRVTRAQR